MAQVTSQFWQVRRPACYGATALAIVANPALALDIAIAVNVRERMNVADGSKEQYEQVYWVEPFSGGDL